MKHVFLVLLTSLCLWSLTFDVYADLTSVSISGFIPADGTIQTNPLAPGGIDLYMSTTCAALPYTLTREKYSFNYNVNGTPGSTASNINWSSGNQFPDVTLYHVNETAEGIYQFTIQSIVAVGDNNLQQGTSVEISAGGLPQNYTYIYDFQVNTAPVITAPTTNGSPIWVKTMSPQLVWTPADDLVSTPISYVASYIDCGPNQSAAAIAAPYRPAGADTGNTALLDADSPWTMTFPFSDGRTYQIFLAAIDSVGNSITDSILIYVDASKPLGFTITNPPDGGNIATTTTTSYNPTVNFSWLTPNPTDLVDIKIKIDEKGDGGIDISTVLSNTTTSYSRTLTANTSYRWYLVGRDIAGNYVTSDATFDIQTTPDPRPTLLTPANNTWINSTQPTLTWSSQGKNPKKFKITFDADGQTPFNGSIRDNLPPGTSSYTVPAGFNLQHNRTYYWMVTVNDKCGNALTSNSASTPPTHWRFSVDTSKPATPVVTAPGKFTNSTTPTLEWTDPFDTGSGVQYVHVYNPAVDTNMRGNTQDPTDTDYDTSSWGLADGSEVTWYLILTDRAGNQTTVDHSFVVDTTPPVITNAALVNTQSPVKNFISNRTKYPHNVKYYLEATVTDKNPLGNPIRWDISQISDTPEISFSTAEVMVSSPSPYLLRMDNTTNYYEASENVPDGNYTITIYVTDRAGNETSKIINVTMDSTYPIIRDIYPQFKKADNIYYTREVLVYSPFVVEFSENVLNVSSDSLNFYTYNDMYEIHGGTTIDPTFVPPAAYPRAYFSPVTTGIRAFPFNPANLQTFVNSANSGRLPPNTPIFPSIVIDDAAAGIDVPSLSYSTKVRDLAGNVLTDVNELTCENKWPPEHRNIYNVFFTDSEQPNILSTEPVNGAIRTAPFSEIRILFDELIDPYGIWAGTPIAPGVLGSQNSITAANTNQLKITNLLTGADVSANYVGSKVDHVRLISPNADGKTFNLNTQIVLTLPAPLTDGSYEISLNSGASAADHLIDMAGNPMDKYSWRFTIDTKLPMVATRDIAGVATDWTFPEPAGVLDLRYETREVVIHFSEPMDPSTFSTNMQLQNLSFGSTANFYTLYEETDRTLRVRFPDEQIGNFLLTLYTIGGSHTGIRDKNGQPLAGNRNLPAVPRDYTFSFTLIESDSPRITFTSPQNAAVNIPVSASLVLQFNKTMSSTAVIEAISISPAITVTDGVHTSIMQTAFKNYGHDSNPGAHTDPFDRNIPWNLFTWTGVTSGVILTPYSNLHPDTTYVLSVRNSATDTTGLPMDTTEIITFKTVDNVSPKLIEINPRNNQINVAIDQQIKLFFDDILDSTTINSNSFVLLEDRAEPLTDVTQNITFSYDPNAPQLGLTITPINTLKYEANYKITIKSYLTDDAGNHFSGPASYTFKTIPDSTPITVTFVSPTANTSVPTSVNFIVRFNKEMNTSSVQSALSLNPGNLIDAADAAKQTFIWSNNNTELRIVLLNQLQSNKNYSFTVSTAAQDRFGIFLQSIESFNFRTIDYVAPQIIEIIPANNSINIPVNSQLEITFSEIINSSTFNENSFIVSYNYSNNAVTIDTTGWNVQPVLVPTGAGTDLFNFLDLDNPPANILIGPRYILKNTAGSLLEGNDNKIIIFNEVDYTIENPVTGNYHNLTEPGAPYAQVIYNGNSWQEYAPNAVLLSDYAGANTNKLIITPNQTFRYNTTFQLYFKNTITDLSGNQLPTTKYYFTTEPDLTPVTASLTVPIAANLTKGVQLDSNFVINFSKSMNKTATERAISISPPDLLTAGPYPNSNASIYSWSANDTILQINPLKPLIQNKNYTFTISVAAEDIYGTHLNTPVNINFISISTTPPVIVSKNPDAGDINVAVSQNFQIVFNKDLQDPGSQYYTNMIKMVENYNNNGVTADLTYTPVSSFSPPRTLQWAPVTPLKYNTTYTVVMSNLIKDSFGNSFQGPYTYTFTTTRNTSQISIAVVEPDRDIINNVPLDSGITLRFTKADGTLLQMNTAKVESAVSLLPGIALTPGVSFTWRNQNSEVTIKSGADLDAATSYVLTIKTTAEDIYGITLPQAWSLNFNTVDNRRPLVSSTSPASSYFSTAISAYNVPVTQGIIVNFDKEMDPNTFNTSTFQLGHLAGSVGSYVYAADTVEGNITFSNSNKTVTFTPYNDLYADGTYSVILNGFIQDLSGNSITGNYDNQRKYVFQFVVTGNANFPQIITTGLYPMQNTMNVPVNVKPYATFDSPMNNQTIDTAYHNKNFLLYDVTDSTDPVYVSAGVTYNSTYKRMTMTVGNPLAYSKNYQLQILTAIKASTGRNLQQGYQWNFTTEPDPFNDLLPPYLSISLPAKDYVNVSVNEKIYLVFSEPIDPASLTTKKINLKDPTGNTVAGTFNYYSSYTVSGSLRSNVVIFTPSSSMKSNTKYTVTVTKNVRDLAGNQFDGDLNTTDADDFSWSFTTETINYPIVSSITDSSNVSVVNGVNVSIATPLNITFSKAMNTAISFSLFNTTSTISGTGTWLSGNTIYRFTPAASLQYSTAYNIVAFGSDSTNLDMAEPYTTTFTTAAKPVSPTDPLKILSTSPTHNSVDITPTTTFKITFNKQVITTDFGNCITMTNKSSGTTINKSVFSYTWGSGSKEVTINFNTNLELASVYQIDINSVYVTDYITNKKLDQDEDGTGGETEDNSSISFTTKEDDGYSDTLISWFNPKDSSTNVNITTPIQIGFSGAMFGPSINNTTIKIYKGSDSSGTLLKISNISYNDTTKIATILPEGSFDFHTIYTMYILEGIRDRNSDGTQGKLIKLPVSKISFITEIDNNSPGIVNTECTPKGTNISVDSKIVITFDEKMKTSSLNTDTIKVSYGGVNNVSGKISIKDSKIVTFTPDMPLANSTTYNVTISNNVADLAENNPIAEFSWSFSTKDPEFYVYTFQNLTSPLSLTIYVSVKSGITLSATPVMSVKQSSISQVGVSLVKLRDGLYKGVYNIDEKYPGSLKIAVNQGSYWGVYNMSLDFISPQMAVKHRSPDNRLTVEFPPAAVDSVTPVLSYAMHSSKEKSSAPAQVATDYENQTADLIPLSDVYTIGTPIKTLSQQMALQLSVNAENIAAYSRSKVALYRSNAGKWNYVSSVIGKDYARANERYTGSYALFADTKAPDVKNPSFEDQSTFHINDLEMSAEIYDNGSGVEQSKLQVLIDNMPQDYEYDANTGMLTLAPSLSVGYHTIDIIAQDRAANVSKQFSKNFAVAGSLGISNVTAYPLPADSEITFRYFLNSANTDNVKIKIYDTAGDKITTLYDCPRSFGYNDQQWSLINDDGEELANGVYYFFIEAYESGEKVNYDGKIAIIR